MITYIKTSFWGCAEVEYKSLEDFVNDNYYDIYSRGCHHIRLLYTESRQPVDTKLIEQAFEIRNRRRHKEYMDKLRKMYPYEFRRGPVPGVRSRRNWGGRSKSYKAMFNENIRAKHRNRLREVSCGDWEYSFGFEQRNWKAYRKTQWKEKN